MMTRPIATLSDCRSPVSAVHQVTFDKLAERFGKCDVGTKEGKAWMPADIEVGPRTAERVNSVSLLVLDVEADAEAVKGESGDPLRDKHGDIVKRIIGPEPPAVDDMLADPLPVDDLLTEARKIEAAQKSALTRRHGGQSGNVIQAFNDQADRPWLLKLLWPLIERFVADLAKDIFEKLKDRSKEAVQNHLETRQREAMQKASSAEQSAKEATNPQEKEELEFSATMWREMAQKLQADNDALKAQLNNLVLVAEQEFDSKIKNGQPSIDVSKEAMTLVVGDQRTTLPALPPPKSE